MEEIFVEVNYGNKELSGLYKISNFGRVYSIRLKKIIKCQKVKGYYELVMKKGKLSQRCYVHRLVAIHFLENPNNYRCVNHKDNNPANNNVNNLEWCSHLYNMQYAAKQGHFKKDKDWIKKIKEAQSCKSVVYVDKTTGLSKVYASIQSVREDGFQPSSVCECCKGIRKSHKNKYWYYNT